MADHAQDFQAIAEAVDQHQSFALLSHVRPDGDAIGSQSALGVSLEAMGKTVHLINEDGLPSSLAFLQAAGALRKPRPEPTPVEVVIALDTSNRERLGENALAETAGAGLVVNIDHHVSNDRYGDINHVDPSAPATGQIIHELICERGWPFPGAAAEALFAAISTDTGSFQYPNTTARTYEIAAALIRAGVCPGEISRRLYQSYPARRIHLLRELLGVLRLTAEGRVASWVMTLEMKDRLGIFPDDSEGLIDIIRSVDTVQVAVFFEELRDGPVRISCRSKTREVDLSRICQQFGGGGHPLAAGARVPGRVEVIESQFLHAVHEALS